MQVEIITIGDELTSGRVLDLNACYAALRLTTSGLQVSRVTTVGDDPVRVAEAVRAAMKDSRFVIITGGLGSTQDDLTSRIAAEALNRPLCRDEGKFAQIRRYVQARGIEMTPSLEKMAWVPKDSQSLSTTEDVCGFSVVEGQARLFFLPGVPEQMRYLMDRCVLPEILRQCDSLPATGYRVLKIYGISEPRLAETLKRLAAGGQEVVLGFYPRFPENHITLRASGSDQQTITEALNRVEEEIRALLGPHVFASGEETMAEAVGALLRRKGFTLSTAESCTGGLIGNLLTQVPGSSDYYQGGVVVYSNASKVKLLGVLPETLEEHGAVSAATVRQMAEGIRKTIPSDVGIAVTGIAGPGGGSDAKPVGTVHIGLSADGGTRSGGYRFRGDREQVKWNTALMALDWVRRFLRGDSFIPGL